MQYLGSKFLLTLPTIDTMANLLNWVIKLTSQEHSGMLK